MSVRGNGSGLTPQRGGREVIHIVLLGMAILGVAGMLLSPFWTCVFRGDIRTCPFFNLFDWGPDLRAACEDNIEQVTAAILAYATEHDGKVPESASWQEDIKTYLAGDKEAVEALLHCPATGQPYVFNNRVAGRTIGELGSPAEVPLIWEGGRDNGRAPHTGLVWDVRGDNGKGPRNRRFFYVGHLGGQVWRYPEDSFKELLEEWGHSAG